MEQQNKLTENREIIAFLAEQFPACFSITGDAKPLKIGIFQDLIGRLESDERISNTRLRQAIRHYTSSIRYLSSVKEDSLRVDLEGETGDKVSAEHEQHAAERLAEIQAKVAERKKQRAEQAKAKRKPAPKKARVPARSSEKKVDSKPKKPAQPAKPATPVSESELKEGLAVRIVVGSSPVAATITEVLKGSVRVTLQSGMNIEVATNKVVQA
ncbi:RNA chaperone ProQ [Echinimonas agarilytica]|uniref:RNA chaperone ProQ n=1 Tax=Echinimonas agarilytica TaxID=1215918 RepID=A0AA41WAX2_9GAMM|nr:RNA chaperone ProQ [Echinimonas agarilytica]MCM2681153.1 RNA chaperone ProQ [Echinimonas agarilytica]